MTPWRSFVLGNVRGTKPYMPGDDVIEDFDRLENWGTLILLNEMWRYTTFLQRMFANAQWHRKSKPGCSTAFAARRDRWNVLASGFWPCHGHVAGPPWRRVISDAREIAWAKIAFEDNPAAIFLLMVVHLTPSGWKGYLPRYWKLRVRRFWYEGRDNIQRRAEASINAGTPVLIVGDWNYDGNPFANIKIGGQPVRAVTAPNKIDKFLYIDAKHHGWQVDVNSRMTIPLNSDHDGWRVRFRMVERGA